MQHKWHKEIKAWADGAEIEVRAYMLDEACSTWSSWKKCDNLFDWNREGIEFRIKPQPKEPQYINVYGYLENQNICFQQQMGMPYIGKIKLEDNN